MAEPLIKPGTFVTIDGEDALLGRFDSWYKYGMDGFLEAVIVMGDGRVRTVYADHMKVHLEMEGTNGHQL